MAAPALISTPLDIRNLIPSLVNQDGEWGVPLGTLSHFILLADGQIRSELREIYGSDLTVTPYVGIPYWVPDSFGAGGGVLYSATAASTAVSETWTLTFTSATAFGFKGTVSGPSQGTSGSTGSSSSSTNARITIASTDWDISTPPVSGNIFYISTYNHEPTLVKISSLLAAADLLDSIYGEQVPNTSSDSSERFRNEAMGIIRKLTDPDGQMTLECGRISIDTSPWLLAGGMEDIGDDGNFATDYQDEEGFDR